MMLPYIICHMMTTIDGRIIAERWTLPQDSSSSLDTVTESYFGISDNFQADAELLGRNTVQKDLCPDLFDPTGLQPTKNPTPFIGELTSNRFCIVLDPHGKTLYNTNKLSNENIITVLSEQVSDHYLQHLQDLKISYLFAGADGRDLNTAMHILASEFNIKKIILQGGGLINGAFLKAKLINEISLMIYPSIDGLSGIHTLFECPDQGNFIPGLGQELKLISTQQLDHNILWLRYNIIQSKQGE